MIEKIRKVSNPLTIIAIFAGLAEISGTIVLPLVTEEIQHIYIYFIMFFPVLIVILFFLTLNFNYKVLYSPSDFIDEKNFVKLIKPTSYKEKERKIHQEVTDFMNDISRPEDVQVEPDINDSTESKDLKKVQEPVDTIKSRNTEENNFQCPKEYELSYDKSFIEEIINVNNEVVAKDLNEKYQNKLLTEYKNIENMVIEKFEKFNGDKFKSNVTFKGKNIRAPFDGMLIENGTTTFIDIKIIRNLEYKRIKNHISKYVNILTNINSNLNGNLFKLRIIFVLLESNKSRQDVDTFLNNAKIYSSENIEFNILKIDEI